MSNRFRRPSAAVCLPSLLLLLAHTPLAIAELAAPAVHLRRDEVMRRAPDAESPGLRVWNLQRTATQRTNLVEMRGALDLHTHPDASHSLVLLEGRLTARVGEQLLELGPGDYLSIPAGLPHGYRVPEGTERALLTSMDAPAYDPARTELVEPAGAAFPPPWPVAPGWRREAEALPPPFAPTLPARGHIELRFAPDFFDRKATTFWSYAAVWWMPRSAAPGARWLGDLLARYHLGLARAVLGDGTPLAEGSFRVTLRRHGQGWVGRGRIVEPFTTRQPLALGIEVRRILCPAVARQALLIAVSPSSAPAVWQPLRDQLARFTCPAAATAR